MPFTLRQLEVFLSIAKTGNMTRAAEQLNMSQSAASSALKDLETEFGILLFDRIGKRLQLNEQGSQLQARADSLIDQARELEQTLSNTTQPSPLHIGATLTIANSLAIQIVAQYLQTYPEAPISLDIHNTEHIVDKVLNYELDMGLIEGESNHPQLNVIPWRDDQLHVFCSPDHPLAAQTIENGRTVDDQDLLDAKWILREPGSGTRQTFDRAMHGLIPKLNITLELRETEAIKCAVKHNIGIGCLSSFSLDEEFARGELIKLHTPSRNLKRKFYLITHRHKHMSHSLRTWLELCEQWSENHQNMK